MCLKHVTTNYIFNYRRLISSLALFTSRKMHYFSHFSNYTAESVWEIPMQLVGRWKATDLYSL